MQNLSQSSVSFSSLHGIYHLDLVIGANDMKLRGAATTLLLASILAGCAGNPMRQYDDELKGTVDLVKSGAVKQAIEQLEKNNSGTLSSDKDLLYYFEKGELLTLDSNYPSGRDSWLKADEFVADAGNVA